MFIMFRRPAKFLCRRAYATTSSTTAGSKTSRFDRSALKPTLALILFATVLTNVSEQQKRYGELERRYKMKNGIYEELIERAKNEDFDFDIQKEMMLVDKLFSRSQKSNTIEIEKEAALVREQSLKTDWNQEMILNSLNSKGTEESLDDLFKDIMKDLDVSEERKEIQQYSPHKRSDGISNDIVTDKEWLDHDARVEQERLKFRPSTEKHLLIDNPGDYNMAAEDTKVKKFL